jgi:hypothetical protein
LGGGITPSPHSLSPEDFPSLGDLFSQQAGISVGVHRMKHPRTGIGASSDMSPQSGLSLVHFDLLRMSVCTGGDENNSLARGFVGPAALVGRHGCCVRDGGAVLIGHRGCRALIQEGPPLVFLAGVLLVCVRCWSSVYAFPASPIFAMNLKSGVVVTGVAPRRSRSLVDGWWWHRQQRCLVLAAHRRVPLALRWLMPTPG